MSTSIQLAFILLLSLLPSNSLSMTQGVADESPRVLDLSTLKQQAGGGDSEAEYALGVAYEKGTGVKKNSEQAANWYRKAAEKGHAKAQNSLGVLYWLGDGVEKDKAQAVQWYRKSARQGDANAMFNLGAAYYNGEGVPSINDNLALAWFLLASEAGSSSGKEAADRAEHERSSMALTEAHFTIGEMYEKGVDMPQDLRLAAAWYRKAADRNSNGAKIRLASLAINEKNYSEARRWCEAGARSQDPSGCYCLGYLYQNGLGVAPDPKEAFRWYLESARNGNVKAMQTVGRMYSDGIGTKPDHPEAFWWYLVSARKGNREVIPDAQKLRSSMNPQEWKRTQKKLRERYIDLKWVDELLESQQLPNSP